MTVVESPLIDPRTSDELAADTEVLLRRYLALDEAEPVPGAALVRIFARLGEIAIDRLNRVPDKNLLAFLDLIGVSPRPPQEARVPLTFALAAGAGVDALVPARTAVAAVPLEGEDAPPRFETERELVVTRSRLVAAFVREPDRDRWRDVSDAVAGTAVPFLAFRGEAPVPHELYVAHDVFALDDPKTISLHLGRPGGDPEWPLRVAWERWDGGAWVAAQATVEEDASDLPVYWVVTLADVPAIPPREVSGVTRSWLRGRLETSLPHGQLSPASGTAPGKLGQSGLAPDAAYAENVPLDLARPLHPFGRRTPRTSFYVASEQAFSKPEAAVTIDVECDPSVEAEASEDLALAWEYWNGSGWALLGTSAPHDADGGNGTGFVDETDAFTRSGTISFTAPADWAETAPTDAGISLSRYWLRARIVVGDYGPIRPELRRVSLDFVWLVPRVVALEVSADPSRTGLQGDAAFANDVAVDLGKDFLPFGEKPVFNDAFAVASEEAFSKSGAWVTLNVQVSNPSDQQAAPPPAVPSSDLVLRWEYWDTTTSAWESLGEARLTNSTISDSTNRLAQNGQVSFQLPDGGPVEVNGRPGHWIRVRIVKGNYGRDAQYLPVDANDLKKGYYIVPASFKPPSIRSLSIDYSWSVYRDPPDAVVAVNDFSEVVDPALPFDPYLPPADDRPALYLAFEREGDDIGFANSSTTLFVSLAEPLFQADGGSSPSDTEPPAVVWEYLDGVTWRRLGVEDETRGFSQRGAVTFVGPPDLRRSSQFGREAFWLRARWERGDYGAHPLVRGVLTNTVWARNAITVQTEVLGSSTGEQGQSFRTAAAPVLRDQRVEVREPEVPPPAELEPLAREEGADAVTVVEGEDGGPAEVWVRWHEVPDFAASAARSRHYVLGWANGSIRFGDGRRGLVPPVGRANVRATYRTGGGEPGNRPAGAITELKATVPYIESVVNPEPAGGGADPESMEAVRERGPKTLRHRNRAVAASDYEDLAFEASPDVARVRAFPASGSGSAGAVGLVVVPKSADDQPIPSVALLDRVEETIRKRMPPTADLWVGGPGWLRVTVAAEIVPVRIEEAATVETAVAVHLRRFLHPLTGGHDELGWEFGRSPHRSDLFAVVEATPGVEHVRRLAVTETMTAEPPVRDAFLVYSTAHDLVLVGGSG